MAFNTGNSFPGSEDYLFIALYHNAKVLAVRLFEDGDTFGAAVTEVLEFPSLDLP